MKIIGVCILVSLCVLGGWFIGKRGGVEKSVRPSPQNSLYIGATGTISR